MRRPSFPVAFLLIAPLLLSACWSAGGGTHTGSGSTASTHSSSSFTGMPQPDIAVSEPVANATVRSPLTVHGEARGSWYFEASFPVSLRDGHGKEIATAPARAQGDWMSNDLVPFVAMFTAFHASTQTGSLVLEKDNPSGLPEHGGMLIVPVHFTP